MPEIFSSPVFNSLSQQTKELNHLSEVRNESESISANLANLLSEFNNTQSELNSTYEDSINIAGQIANNKNQIEQYIVFEFKAMINNWDSLKEELIDFEEQCNEVLNNIRLFYGEATTIDEDCSRIIEDINNRLNDLNADFIP